jgi:beta-glucosidase
MTITAETVSFPANFLWGAATAAYQIEGAVDADGRGESIWDVFSHTPGRVLHGDTGDIACDHYHRLTEDLDLMRELGLRSYRFSVAWPRIQPTGSGAANPAGLSFYGRLIDGLLERGIAPALTLYHWDLPQALEESGGWRARDVTDRFADYAGIVASAFGDRVRLWMTLNEPWVAAWLGHGAGIHAPGRSDATEAATAQHHFLLAHGKAVSAIRAAVDGPTDVGVVFNMSPVYPGTEHPDDVAAAALADGQLNRSFADPVIRGRYPTDLGDLSAIWQSPDLCRSGDLEQIGAPIDFLGVNYYYPRWVVAPERVAEVFATGLVGRYDPVRSFGLPIADVSPFGTPVTAMGWPIEPRALSDLLVRLRTDYGNPAIYVTENGAAFPDYAAPEGRVVDPERIAYLDGHLRAVAAAIAQGVDVRGYYVWSLLDNFEWAFGYSRRFGLVYVDYPTGKRTPKDSFRWYREVTGRNGLT